MAEKWLADKFHFRGKKVTEIIGYTKDYLAMISDYGSPDRHRHLTAHLVCALSGTLKCFIGSETVECDGVLIYPDIEHEIQATDRMLVFLFANTSKITNLMEEKYLSGKSYAILSGEELKTIKSETLRGTDKLDERILKDLELYTTDIAQFDQRVHEVIEELEAAETISGDTIENLSKAVCLSQSRLSHLFKRDIGISLNRYISFMKMKKAYEYVLDSESLTAAALHAGFDTSSHMAAACKRMFGISLSAFMKSQVR